MMDMLRFAGTVAVWGTGDRGRWCSYGPWRFTSPLLLLLFLFGCSASRHSFDDARLVNYDHLDHLTETVERDGDEIAIVHIYSEAPNYAWVHDDDEGAACVDDAARAAVVLMRDFELRGDPEAKERAQALLRFILYMQADNGLFYNFVWNSELDINKEHQNSRADRFSWWSARSIWALGRCAEVFSGDALGTTCAEAARRALPHVDERLQAYGQTFEMDGRRYPRWLLFETASDATSELLLGLTALDRARPDGDLNVLINRLAEGMSMMQYGRIGEFPYGAHASWTEVWHAWGNAQTQALSSAGRAALLASAQHEAEHFYPLLLVDGWWHSIDFDDPSKSRRFEQIAYGVRGVALGLIGLYDATGDTRYATLAGLAASWFTGNNVAGIIMYDPETGRGYDGITAPDEVNRNAGAESTVEALMSIQEVERVPEARKWLFARASEPYEVSKHGTDYTYRIFQVDGARADSDRIGVILNRSDQTSLLLQGDSLAAFLRE